MSLRRPTERRSVCRIGGEARRGGRRCTGAPSYCGRAFRMAFTSSATAVSANSNCSCSERREGKQREAVKRRGKRRGVFAWAAEIKNKSVPGWEGRDEDDRNAGWKPASPSASIMISPLTFMASFQEASSSFFINLVCVCVCGRHVLTQDSWFNKTGIDATDVSPVSNSALNELLSEASWQTDGRTDGRGSSGWFKVCFLQVEEDWTQTALFLSDSIRAELGVIDGPTVPPWRWRKLLDEHQRKQLLSLSIPHLSDRWGFQPRSLKLCFSLANCSFGSGSVFRLMD